MGWTPTFNHAASGPLLGADFLALGVEQLIGDLAQTLEDVGVEDVSYQAIAVADELVEVLFWGFVRTSAAFPSVYRLSLVGNVRHQSGIVHKEADIQPTLSQCRKLHCPSYR